MRWLRTSGRARAGASAAAVAAAAALAAVPAGAREIVAARAAQAPVIDGRLDDACWSEATPVSDFVNLRRGVEPATQQTIVRLCFDARALYAAFDCLEDRVQDISAAIAQRDAENIPEEDDCVAVSLDTFCDKRSCYAFLVSALGTKRDVHASECGRSDDEGWDAVWDAAVARSADRWTAELAIPFSALRFAGGASPVWGVDFARVEMPHQEYSRWHGWQGEFLDASGYGTLAGLANIEHPAGLELLPYVLAKYDASGLYDYPLEPEDAAWNAHVDGGLDVEYAPAAYATANLTLNPDFAQIEADPNQINLGGDELRLEERRPFFSENADLFQMPLSLLYTRRMEDIVSGGKVTGKAGGASFAALYVRSNDLPRDDEGDALTDSLGVELPAVTHDYGALVLRQDLFGSATAGLYGATRERGSSYSRVGAVTAGLSPLDCLRLNALAARTWSSAAGGDEAYALEWSYDAPNANSEGSFVSVGEGFSPAMGFIDEDLRGTFGGSGSLWRRFETDNGWLDEYQLCAWAGRYQEHGGPVRSHWVGGEVALELARGIGVGLEYNTSYDVADYPDSTRSSHVNLYTYTGLSSWSGLVASAEFGGFHHSRYVGGHFGARVQPAGRLTIEADVNGVALREYEHLDWWVGEVRANYLLSPTLFVRALALGEHVVELDGETDAEDRTQRVDLNLLLGWELSPGSTLYIAYNIAHERENGESRFLEPTAALKVSYLLTL